MTWFQRIRNIICKCDTNTQPLLRWELEFGLSRVNFTTKARINMRLNTLQQVLVTINPVNRIGQPAPIDGQVVWESSDPSVEITNTSDDGKTITLTARNPGASQITATFDADLGEGVRNILASGAVEVTLAEAVTGELAFGDPTDQPDAV